MRIEDINITQESVEEFFDEIDVDALAKSIEVSLASHSQNQIQQCIDSVFGAKFDIIAPKRGGDH